MSSSVATQSRRALALAFALFQVAESTEQEETQRFAETIREEVIIKAFDGCCKCIDNLVVLSFCRNCGGDFL